MQTIFLLEKHRNTGLFPLVMQAFNDGPANSGVIYFRDLHWRKMPSGHIAVEIYDAPVTQLPHALAYATYELCLYDFRDDIKLEVGWYKYRSAHAQVIAQSPGRGYLYEVAIIGKRLSDANDLYRRIMDGDIAPSAEPK